MTTALISEANDIAAGDVLQNLASFARHLRAENRSASTVDTYSKAVVQLDAFLASSGMPRRVASITREHVESFLIDLQDRGRKPATVAQRFRSLQAYFKYVTGEGEVARNPMGAMRPPSIPETPPPVLTTTELRALVADCGGPGFADRRDRAIVMFLLDTGSRRQEIAGLRLSDLDLDLGLAYVTGKGSRMRPSAFGKRTAQALDRYLRVRNQRPDAGSEWVWLGKRGRLTATGIAQLLRRRGRAAGLGEHLRPHLFRHTFAHRWLSQGGSEGDLMVLAGWRSRQMLSRYGQSAASERARESHRRFSPGDQL